MKLKASLKTLGFAVMLAASSMSHAVTTDWGTVAPGSTFSTEFSGQRFGAFEDKYTFTLLTDGDGYLKRNLTLTLDEDGLTQSGFSGLTYGLYTSANALIASSYEALSKTYMYATIAAGSYYLKVSGTGWINATEPSPPPPIYNGLVAITASVPEPQTYAMFLAGLGIIGTVVRRRSRSF